MQMQIKKMKTPPKRNLANINPQENDSKILNDLRNNFIDSFKKKRKRVYNEMILNLESFCTYYEKKFDNLFQSEFKKYFKGSDSNISFIKDKIEENIIEKKDDEIPEDNKDEFTPVKKYIKELINEENISLMQKMKRRFKIKMMKKM